MIRARIPKAREQAESANLTFPTPDDWKNIVHDAELTKVQENELAITIRRVLADIERYQARPPRNKLVPALKRLEKALGRIQYEMERSKDLMRYFLSNSSLQFIGESFTFTTLGQAIGKAVFPIDQDYVIQSMIEKNNFITMADLENQFRNDRKHLGLQHGGEVLKHFIGVIHADIKTWVELDRQNEGGRPADICRQYIIRRLAERSFFIIGKRATTTHGGAFTRLCTAVLPACGFRSKGIEKTIEAVLGKMGGQKAGKQVKRNARHK